MSKNQGRQFRRHPIPLGLGAVPGGGNYPREMPTLKWHKLMKDAEAFAANVLSKLLIRTHRCLLSPRRGLRRPLLSHGRHQVRGCRLLGLSRNRFASPIASAWFLLMSANDPQLTSTAKVIRPMSGEETHQTMESIIFQRIYSKCYRNRYQFSHKRSPSELMPPSKIIRFVPSRGDEQCQMVICKSRSIVMGVQCRLTEYPSYCCHWP